MTASPLAALQDKFVQKQHFQRAGVPVADFCGAEDAAAVKSAVESYGTPLMLKAKRYVIDQCIATWTCTPGIPDTTFPSFSAVS